MCVCVCVCVCVCRNTAIRALVKTPESSGGELDFHTPCLRSDCSEQLRYSMEERTEKRWKLEKD